MTVVPGVSTIPGSVGRSICPRRVRPLSHGFPGCIPHGFLHRDRLAPAKDLSPGDRVSAATLYRSPGRGCHLRGNNRPFWLSLHGQSVQADKAACQGRPMGGTRAEVTSCHFLSVQAGRHAQATPAHDLWCPHRLAKDLLLSHPRISGWMVAES